MKRSRPPGPRANGESSRAERARVAIARPASVAAAGIVALAVVMGVDVFRIGFFADDFHFLDVARRVPLWRSLGGQYGIYPWYRPLSRELYFWVTSRAGGLVAAHALGLACAVGCAWQLRGIALRLATPRAAAFAALLFLMHAITRFLTCWASGFQDLLALLLLLLALRAQFEGHLGRATLWAFLAPFAKETAVLVYPILTLHVLLVGRDGRHRRWWLAQAAAFAVVAAIHLAVRADWHTGGREAAIVRSVPALLAAIGRLVVGFVGGAPMLELRSIALAVVAAGAATAVLAAGATSTPSGAASTAAADRTAGRSLALIAAAAALGFAPLVAGHLAGLTLATGYYAFPAAPWLALLGGLTLDRLPRNAGAIAVPALVAWNTLAFGYRAPDLLGPWQFRDWNWAEAVRLSAIARRFAEDLRTSLVPRPESLVVLYHNVPNGCYFQTEDGPATRESLGDPTVRSYWLNTPPYRLEPGHFAIVRFDSRIGHLANYQLPAEAVGNLTATAVACGNAAKAWAFASSGDSASIARYDLCYYRFAAALIAEGPGGARRELAAAGLADTTSAEPERWAEVLVGRASCGVSPGCSHWVAVQPGSF